MPDLYQWVHLPWTTYGILMFTKADLFSELALHWIFDSSNLSLRRSGYNLPFNEYPYLGHLQYPPPYSQQSFPPPFPSKQHFPPIAHPLIFPTYPSSLRRRLSHDRSSFRIHRHISNPPSRSTSLEKRRRTSLNSTQPLAFLSGALSAIQRRPHGWRSGYKPPSRSSFGKHFERLIAAFIPSMSNDNFLMLAYLWFAENLSCQQLAPVC